MQSNSEENSDITEYYFVSCDADVMAVVMASHIFSKRLGFKNIAVNEITTSVSELATNIIKYASNGTVYLSEISLGYKKGIEIKVKDNGPGIADIEIAMQDHESSSGTLGLGLPGVKRMMEIFNIESSPETGTQIIVSKFL